MTVGTWALLAKFIEFKMPGAYALTRKLETLRDLGIEPKTVGTDDIVPPQFWDKRLLTQENMDTLESDIRSLHIGSEERSITPLQWLEQLAVHLDALREKEPGGLAMLDQILGELAESPNLDMPLLEDAGFGTGAHEKDLLFGESFNAER